MYNTHGMVPKNHSWWTVVMNNIPHMPGEERVLAATLGSSREKRQLRPEKKSVDWMEDIVWKFTETGKLVMDTCNRTLATAKARIMLPEHRALAECEKTVTVSR